MVDDWAGRSGPAAKNFEGNSLAGILLFIPHSASRDLFYVQSLLRLAWPMSSVTSVGRANEPKKGGFEVVKTNAPKQITWIVAAVVGVVGILGQVVPIAAIAGYAFWMVCAAFVLLAIATVAEGL